MNTMHYRVPELLPEQGQSTPTTVPSECGLTTLEIRRLRRYHIEVFKIFNGYENIYRNMYSHLKR